MKTSQQTQNRKTDAGQVNVVVVKPFFGVHTMQLHFGIQISCAYFEHQIAATWCKH